MSFEFLDKQLDKFLQSNEPEVLCIRGPWGVGKTYAWNEAMKRARAAKRFGLPAYAYVSLFGITSLAEMKFAIATGNNLAIATSSDCNVKDLKDKTIGVGIGLLQSAITKIHSIPYIKNKLGDITELLFTTVYASTICIDDIERRGKNLDLKDVLGIASYLKVEKKCKVVLILNRDGLEGDTKSEFDLYFDKVIDRSVEYNPPPDYLASVLLSSETPAISAIREFSSKLNIRNFRVIQKIIRHVTDVVPLFSDYDPEVFRSAIKTITLVSWCIYEPKLAPDIEFIRNRDTWSIYEGHAGDEEHNASSKVVLRNYEFGILSPLDLALLEGIEAGYFNEDSISLYAKIQNDVVIKDKSSADFSACWRKYHDTFEDNSDEVIDCLHNAFLKCIPNVSFINVQATILLLRDLGRGELATSLLNSYLQSLPDERKSFDLSNHPFSSELYDPELLAAFHAKLSTYHDVRPPKDILLSIAKGVFTEENLMAASALNVDAYYEVIRYSDSTASHEIALGCLKLGHVGGASKEMAEIFNRAKEAVTRIGRESRINARRVKKLYNIDIHAEDIAGSDPQIPSS